VSQDLPALIVRLKTLQRLHAESAGFSARVASLETLAESLEAQTAGNALVLQDVKEGLASNITTMLTNIEMVRVVCSVFDFYKVFDDVASLLLSVHYLSLDGQADSGTTVEVERSGRAPAEEVRWFSSPY
jgi:hypothetical protein